LKGEEKRRKKSIKKERKCFYGKKREELKMG
jgi:hypothetical protein